jgi:Holliday junction resolvasome RuvABC ATP-dependent DNA helicase subunit
LKGPSGFGKTLMAHNICRFLARDSYQFFLAETKEFDFIKRVVFIDEIHKVNDLERFYPLMDERSHVFVFATNHDAILPEAFVNRTYEFIFDDYSEEELQLIARESCKFSATDKQILDILIAGNNNPRIIKSICERLWIYFSENKIRVKDEMNFSAIISEVFKINNGLDILCVRYIETLKSLGGVASFNLIKTILHTDEDSIKNTVEPLLMKKGIIRITSKGRSLVQ